MLGQNLGVLFHRKTPNKPPKIFYAKAKAKAPVFIDIRRCLRDKNFDIL